MSDTSHQRIIDIFKYMVQFLEIYGNENFGESAEVDWSKVWNYCSKCDILDFNPEIEQLVYNTSDEKFRDEVFAFLEKQAVDGYPLWRLFHMSQWLYDKCDDELHQKEHQKDVEYFNKTRCYRCKKFRCKLHIMYSTLVEPICGGRYDSLEEFNNQEHFTEIMNIKLGMNCAERQRLLEQSEKMRSYHRHRGTHRFKYDKFNVNKDKNPRCNEWIMNPSELKRCPYFEESNMTPEKFEKLYGEIPRYE